MHAYDIDLIRGTNKEKRELETDAVLEGHDVYKQDRDYLDRLVNDRKRATAVRVGVEHEWETWRAWLASQGRNDG